MRIFSSLFRALKTFLRRTCLIIGGLFVFLFVMGIISAIFIDENKQLPKDFVLVLNMDAPLTEVEAPRSLMDPFTPPGMTIRSFVETLDKAAADARVRGLLVSLDDGGLELAHIQEMRAAIKRFRSSGKFAHVYTASFADLQSGIGAYYLASAFDEIWMQPIGFLTISGISMEMPFAKETLDKIGVNPEFLHREEYKSAMESFTNTDMSPANREMMQSILDDLSNRVFTDIALDRGIENAELMKHINKGLLSGDEAVAAKLITKVDYADTLLKKVRTDVTGDEKATEPPLVLLEDYADVQSDDADSRHASVALVEISGEIVPGNEPRPGYATGDYIASAILDAAENDTIKVLVVRVDSPGGSPSASETIRRAILTAKERGKKVIVSMGPVAASGGYWVAVDADKIYAMPSTLTGSIGVIMGKFELSGLWDKVGVNWDGVSWGQNAQLWSPNKPLSAEGRAILDDAIQNTYEAFMDRVAQGRKIDPAKVRDIAKGRAWTGTQALANGLVDELGGLDEAMTHAAELAGIADKSTMGVLVLPEPLSPLEELMQLGKGRSWSGASLPFIRNLEPSLRKWNAMEDMGPLQAYDPSLPAIRP